MHSWIFRNRDRLRQVYGSPEPVERPRDQAEDAAQQEPWQVPDAMPCGSVERRDEDVLVVPMPRVLG